MAKNLVHTVDRGSEGIYLKALIEDGAGIVDLDDYDVTFSMRHLGTAIFTDEVVEKVEELNDDAEVIYNVRYEWTAAITEAANFTEKICKGWFTLTKAGFTDYWPRNSSGSRAYVTVRIREI
jgi:hypothetical protein